LIRTVAVVKDYSDTGLPAFLEFEMAAGSNYFTLDVNGQRINQALTDHATIPTIAVAPASVPAPPPAPPIREVQAPPPPAPPLPTAKAPPPQPAAPTIPTAQPADAGDDDELWRGIELEFNKEGAKVEENDTPDVQLEEQK